MVNDVDFSSPLLPKVAGEIKNRPTKSTSKAGASQSFSSILESYMDLIETTGELELTAENMQLDFAAGKTDDMAGLLLAQQKALASLNFTVQVTNKALQAYQEIMRISM